MQKPLLLHALERHTTPPLAIVHGPSPLAYPQRLSLASQTLLAQTSVPAATVHVPLSVGAVCGGSLGTTVPFGSFALHWLALSLHHCAALQSVSFAQPTRVRIGGPSSGSGSCVERMSYVPATIVPVV